MLAASPRGCTEAIMRAHRFGVMLLAGLLRAGLAKAEAETTRTGNRRRADSDYRRRAAGACGASHELREQSLTPVGVKGCVRQVR
jgi:hypothetical protein